MFGLGALAVLGSRAASPASAQEDTATICVTDLSAAQPVSELWRDVRRTLDGWAGTVDSAPYRYEVTLYTRDLAPDGRTIVGEAVRSNQEQDLPLTDESGLLTLPTITALLSLEETHCFSASRSATGQVALRFEPDSGGSSDRSITGTFWIDGETGRLEALEYTDVNEVSVSGRVEVQRLDAGAWIARSWRVGLTDPGDSTRAGGVREFGGVVTAVNDASGTAVFEDGAVGLLTGVVYDSTQSGPLVGAAVAFAGTDQWTETDARGEFSIASAIGGDYRLVFGHPRLDSLGFISQAVPVSLVRGEETSVALAVPTLGTILEGRCPPGTLADNRRVLLGVVKDAATGIPVAGAEVVASWQTIPQALQSYSVDDQQAVGVTDSLGTYAACGVPVGRSIVVHAAHQGRMSDFFRITYGPTTLQVGSRERQTLDRPVGRLDLEVAPQGSAGTVVRGQVTDAASERGIDGAQVRVVGTSLATRTDSDGAFRLADLPAGAHSVTVARIGYRRVRHEFDLDSGAVAELPADALAMPPGVLELAPIVVRAEGVPIGSRHLALGGFYERREMGFGHFATREEFEEWSPSVATDVLRHMPGIRVRPNPAYGYGGDARRYLVGTTRVVTMASSMGLECPALYFIDGLYAGNSKDQNTYIDAILSINNVSAIEVYSGPTQTPARFNWPGADCGVVVFWLR
jgi:hypothetical protein